MSELKKIIEQAFEQRDEISFNTKGEIRDSVEETLNQLDVGKIRVCEKISDEWIVNQWIKKAILGTFDDLAWVITKHGGVQYLEQ